MNYSALSIEALTDSHQKHESVLVELSPTRGKLLRSLLEKRDRVERDLLIDANIFQLACHQSAWFFFEVKARLFHRRLLLLQQYVAAVDAAYGWETNGEGQQVFVLLPLSQRRTKLSGKGQQAQASATYHGR